MRVLGFIELQGAGDRFEHAVRDAFEVAAFDAGVVGRADAGEDGDLFATQTGDAAGAEGGEACLLGSDLRAAGGEELSDLAARIHLPKPRRGWVGQGDPVSASFNRDSRSAGSGAFVVSGHESFRKKGNVKCERP